MKRARLFLQTVLSLALVVSAGAAEPRPEALAHFTGPELQGGAKDLFGSSFDGEQVNYVYALPTGAHATMKVKFPLKSRARRTAVLASEGARR